MAFWLYWGYRIHVATTTRLFFCYISHMMHNTVLLWTGVTLPKQCWAGTNGIYYFPLPYLIIWTKWKSISCRCLFVIFMNISLCHFYKGRTKLVSKWDVNIGTAKQQFHGFQTTIEGCYPYGWVICWKSTLIWVCVLIQYNNHRLFSQLNLYQFFLMRVRRMVPAAVASLLGCVIHQTGAWMSM